MMKYINQVAEFETIDELNNFLFTIPAENIIRISGHSKGYTVIFKVYQDISNSYVN